MCVRESFCVKIQSKYDVHVLLGKCPTGKLSTECSDSQPQIKDMNKNKIEIKNMIYRPGAEQTHLG